MLGLCVCVCLCVGAKVTTTRLAMVEVRVFHQGMKRCENVCVCVCRWDYHISNRSPFFTLCLVIILFTVGSWWHLIGGQGQIKCKGAEQQCQTAGGGGLCQIKTQTQMHLLPHTQRDKYNVSRHSKKWLPCPTRGVRREKQQSCSRHCLFNGWDIHNNRLHGLHSLWPPSPFQN